MTAELTELGLVLRDGALDAGVHLRGHFRRDLVLLRAFDQAGDILLHFFAGRIELGEHLLQARVDLCDRAVAQLIVAAAGLRLLLLDLAARLRERFLDRIARAVDAISD